MRPAFTKEEINEINERVIRKRLKNDEVDLVRSFSFVTVFKSAGGDKWDKIKLRGPLFLYNNNVDSTLNFLILNNYTYADIHDLNQMISTKQMFACKGQMTFIKFPCNSVFCISFSSREEAQEFYDICLHYKRRMSYITDHHADTTSFT